MEKKFRLLLLLALLMTAATGAWAQGPVDGTIVWPIGDEASATVSASIKDAISSTSVTTGSGLTVGSSIYFDTNMVKYTPTTANAGNVEGVMIEYRIEAVDGYKFKPTGVDYAAVKVGNDNLSYSWSYTIDGVESAITDVSYTSVLRSNGNNSATAQLMHSESITADGCSVFTLRFYISNCGTTKNICIGNITISGSVSAAAAGYTVSLKDGVKDADKWTVKVGEGQAQALPIGGLKGDGSETVTLQYNGRLKVKGVKATSDAAAPSVPDGALSGVFSVSSTKQVYFSKGNLRYASSKWSFFDNQYDYYTGYSADAWDHFGWSTSATTYGMNTSTDNGDYSGDFVDWGATMGTGWFTLSKDEWTYLFKTRSASTVGGTENGRYAKAKVNNVPGIILFPDTYTHPDGVTAPVGVNATGDTGWNGNSYTVADWTKMESAGCVFLPAAGYREGSSVTSPGSYGYYWSATPSGTNNAYRVYSNSRNLNPENTANRRLGLSVRLVCEGATSDAQPAVWDGDLSKLTAESTAEFATATDGMTITGALAEGVNVKVSIADGATVTLDGVTINGVDNMSYQWAGINCLGDATIILSGTNTVKGFYSDYPGIYVPENKTVTIQGSGSLTASSSDISGVGGAGIGSGYQLACGNITIMGGSITAMGSSGAAGIGSGNNGSCGNITITGGTINASAGNGAAGIGSGNNGSFCGNITITGGNITATGGTNAAGIGSGNSSSCGNITITGGTINATGTNQAAGIGSGYAANNKTASCGTITITTGVTKVTATKGNSAPNSIGVGKTGVKNATNTCGTVTIGCTLDTNGNPVGGTVYWENNAAVNGGHTYLTTSPLEYQPSN